MNTTEIHHDGWMIKIEVKRSHLNELDDPSKLDKQILQLIQSQEGTCKCGVTKFFLCTQLPERTKEQITGSLQRLCDSSKIGGAFFEKNGLTYWAFYSKKRC